MATITTRDEQRSTAAAAREVGGYSELVRLAAERGRGGDREIVRTPDGDWQVKSSHGVASGA